MMLGEPHRPNPTIHVPPWLTLDDPTAEMYSNSPYPLSGVNSEVSNDTSPYHLNEALATLQRYLPSNELPDPDPDSDSEFSCLDPDSPVDAYSCDHFRMFEFKVRRCARGRSHDWTDCPFAHPGEKARRRDPRKFHYSGSACPDFRKGHCKKGDSCEFAHGVFECWLHPARYRTQPCKDGTSCKRRVCFFAHTPEQLRVLPQQSPRGGGSNPVNAAESYDGSPLRQAMEAASSMKGMSMFMSSTPPSVSPEDSPPMSPMTRSVSRSLGSSSINEMVASLRKLHLGKVNSLPCSWNVPVGSPGFVSPRAGSMLRPGFCSLPSTPTRVPPRSGMSFLDFCDEGCEEEPPMERVESGRDLRARMFERLREENSLERVGSTRDQSSNPGAPDVGWVSELVN